MVDVSFIVERGLSSPHSNDGSNKVTHLALLNSMDRQLTQHVLAGTWLLHIYLRLAQVHELVFFPTVLAIFYTDSACSN